MASPPPFTYVVVTGHTGTFLWDGSTGAALYFDQGKTVQSGIAFLKTIKFSQSGVTYSYYAFKEDTPDDDGQTRKWLFEVEPREGETFCTVYYYYDKGEPTFFGGAQKKTPPPPAGRFTRSLA